MWNSLIGKIKISKIFDKGSNPFSLVFVFINLYINIIINEICKTFLLSILLY